MSFSPSFGAWPSVDQKWRGESTLWSVSLLGYEDGVAGALVIKWSVSFRCTKIFGFNRCIVSNHHVT